MGFGKVEGWVGGNKNVKLCRGWCKCKVIGGKLRSVGNGCFNGKEDVLGIEGCSNKRFENVEMLMEKKGEYKSGYGLFEDEICLREWLDKVMRGGMVIINRGGEYKGICNVRCDLGKRVGRKRLENVRLKW